MWLSCKYKLAICSVVTVNTDWHFEMFKRGKDNGHDT